MFNNNPNNKTTQPQKEVVNGIVNIGSNFQAKSVNQKFTGPAGDNPNRLVNPLYAQNSNVTLKEDLVQEAHFLPGGSHRIPTANPSSATMSTKEINTIKATENASINIGGKAQQIHEEHSEVKGNQFTFNKGVSGMKILSNTSGLNKVNEDNRGKSAGSAPKTPDELKNRRDELRGVISKVYRSFLLTKKVTTNIEEEAGELLEVQEKLSALGEADQEDAQYDEKVQKLWAAYEAAQSAPPAATQQNPASTTTSSSTVNTMKAEGGAKINIGGDVDQQVRTSKVTSGTGFTFNGEVKDGKILANETGTNELNEKN